MVEKSSTASLIVAWTLYAGALGLVACYILVPIVWPSRPTRADLARGEAMIRSRYADARTRIGHIALAPAGIARCTARPTSSTRARTAAAPCAEPIAS